MVTRKARIEKLIYHGWAEGRDRENNEKVLLRWALPGEEVEYRLFKRKRNLLLGDLVKIVSPSSFRIKPRCPLFGRCGGCTWQNLIYQQELVWKEKIIREIFEQVAKIDLEGKVRPILRSKRRYFYRGKTELTFSLDQEERLIAGFHQPGKPEVVLPIDRCFLHRPIVNLAFAGLKKILEKTSLPPYLPKTGQGILRSIVFRTNQRGEVLITLVVDNQEDFDFKERDLWLNEFQRVLGRQLVGFGLIKEKRKKGEPVTMALDHWWGEKFLIERVAGIDWPIGPMSFFQNNVDQAERMVTILIQWARKYLSSSVKLLDLYAGIGFLSLPLAHLVNQVMAIEIIKEAVDLGKNLADKNKVKNYSFILGDSGNILTELLEQNASFGAVIVDPPRAGLSKKTVRALLIMRPKTIFYISCNPTAQARDIAFLIKKGGYQLVELQPIDMFPCTWHIESMAVLIS